ncbi:MAG: sugar kinase [Alphaproteobacteria bacterium]|nr:sugar kinase [Alphaproteobacteria bacterium]
MVKKISIAFIGEALIELSLSPNIKGTAQIGIAGDTLNAAIYMRRNAPALSCDIFYVTAFGTDPLSLYARAFIEQEHIDISLIQSRPNHHIGLYAILNDEKGERDFVYWRHDSAARRLFDENIDSLFAQLQKMDMIYLSAISLAILPEDKREQLFVFLTQFRKQGKQIIFDSNYRPALWSSRALARDVIMRAWRITDIALPSLTDEKMLFGENNETEIIDRLRTAGVQFGVLKRGALGPQAIGWDDSSTTYPPATKIVDTTAAGDSFNGCFLAQLIAGKPPATAAYKAHELACKLIGYQGAILPANA